MKVKTLRKIQLFWAYFVGIGAFWGGSCMIFGSRQFLINIHFWELLPYMQEKLPYPEIFFKNMILAGICLLCANAITNTISAILIHKNHKFGALSGLLCGVILILWIAVQFYVFPLNLLSSIYFIFGILQAINGYRWLKNPRYLRAKNS